MEAILIITAGILVVAAANALGPRVAIAPPLILVAVGVLVTMIPAVPNLMVDPEWILVGVLPPLLYSAAVSMPTMEFRRNLAAIGGLSITLVVLSALVVGVVVHAIIPEIPLWTGIAVGAIVSPTDAVATQMVKKLGAPSRVVAILEGESLLNDASALVLLRTAVAATAISVSLGSAVGSFVWAILAAVGIGFVVGKANLLIASRLSNSTVATAVSFTVPYLAYLPAEHVDASGLVASVTAGIVTGVGAARHLTAAHRMSEMQNWRTVELLLEGGVFLLMGLELSSLIADVHRDGGRLYTALGVAALVLVVVLAVRAAFVGPMAGLLHRRARRADLLAPRLREIGDQLPDDVSPKVSRRINRKIADLDYFMSSPLGWRESTIVVWAGMRGAVTVAAAQTLPIDTTSRSLLVLVAFLVALGSLGLQGLTLAPLVRLLGVTPDEGEIEAERRALHERLRGVIEDDLSDRFAADPERYRRVRDAVVTSEDSEDGTVRHVGRAEFVALRQAMIDAQRGELLALRDEGQFSSQVLTEALARLDAEQITVNLYR
ncbi:cation:proton antiporter [Gordonia araii]|uniref:cation:proton antiporter n=1 Tax=Gordonia araii TaxID=263909 RepID=UPI0002EE2EE1|nr:sodium:proton antiporter [Gordonia araii]NNG98740.1 sodium:proton antiporter [Gordonia araii NBRC 100433]